MSTDADTRGAEAMAFPRIALFISDPQILAELETILREKYSSLMLITEKAKLAEFTIPLVVLVDTIKAVSEIRALHPVEGTRILIISQEGDSEIAGAAFDAGADDFVAYPFGADAVVGKTEKYLETFRS